MKTIECCMFQFFDMISCKFNMKKNNHKASTWNEAKGYFDSAQWDRKRESSTARAKPVSSIISSRESSCLGVATSFAALTVLLVSVSVQCSSSIGPLQVCFGGSCRARKTKLFRWVVLELFFFFFLREAWEENSRGLFGTSPTRIQFVVLCCAVPSVSFPMQNLDRVSYLWPFSRKAGRIVNKICAFFRCVRIFHWSKF